MNEKERSVVRISESLKRIDPSATAENGERLPISTCFFIVLQADELVPTILTLTYPDGKVSMPFFVNPRFGVYSYPGIKTAMFGLGHVLEKLTDDLEDPRLLGFGRYPPKVEIHGKTDIGWAISTARLCPRASLCEWPIELRRLDLELLQNFKSSQCFALVQAYEDLTRLYPGHGKLISAVRDDALKRFMTWHQIRSQNLQPTKSGSSAGGVEDD